MNPILLFFLTLVFIADGLMVFLIPVLVYAETQSLTYSGLSYALWWLPRLVLIPVLGAFIDRWGVRPVSIAADLVKCAGCLLVSLVLYLSDDPLIIAISCGLLGAVISIGNAQTVISFEKLIAFISKNVAKDANLLTRLDLVGMILGPILGMLFYHAGFILLLVVVALFYLANSLYFLISQAIPDTAQPEIAMPGIALSPFVHLKKPVLIFMILLAVGNNMFDGLIESSGSAIIEKSMALPIQYFGLIDVCAGLFGFIATFLYGHWVNRLRLLTLFIFGWSTIIISSTLLIYSMNNLVFFLIFYSIGIAGKVFTGNFMRVMRISILPKHQLASVSSLVVLLNQSILPFMWLFLFLSEHYQLSITLFLLIATLISAVSGGWVLYLCRKVNSSIGKMV